MNSTPKPRGKQARSCDIVHILNLGEMTMGSLGPSGSTWLCVPLGKPCVLALGQQELMLSAICNLIQ